MRGIDAAGVYVPRFRVDIDAVDAAWGSADASGVSSKAVPAADEDAVTMAVAASETALESASVAASEIEFVGLATTTPPLEEEMLIPRITRMLSLSSDVASQTATQSTIGFAEVLSTALDNDVPSLIIAADSPEGIPADTDHPLGAGAAAFVVTGDPTVAVRDRSWYMDEQPGIRFRERGEDQIDTLDITTYQRAAIRESIATAIEGLERSADEYFAAALYQPDGGIPYRVTRGLAFDNEVTERGMIADQIGDAGAAGVPIGLVRALNEAEIGDHTVAGLFGSGGGAAAFLLEGGFETPVSLGDAEESVSYAEYLRKRGYVISGGVAGGGAHVSLPSWLQSLDQRYRLVAGECPNCGALAFPPEGACPDCHDRVSFEPVEMPRTGTIAAVTTIGQGGAPPEFAEQQQRDGAFGIAIVELATDTGSVTLPCQLTDGDADSLAIGDDVEAVVRKIYTQEGIPRYGVKFRTA